MNENKQVKKLKLLKITIAKISRNQSLKIVGASGFECKRSKTDQGNPLCEHSVNNC